MIYSRFWAYTYIWSDYEKCTTLAARPNSDHTEAPSWISPAFEN